MHPIPAPLVQPQTCDLELIEQGYTNTQLTYCGGNEQGGGDPVIEIKATVYLFINNNFINYILGMAKMEEDVIILRNHNQNAELIAIFTFVTFIPWSPVPPIQELRMGKRLCSSLDKPTR